MSKFYTVDIDGRKEDLPVLPLPSGINIAFFNLHGNADLTEYCGKKIADILRDSGAEVLITAESKGLQLTHVVAHELGHKFYAVARKSQKLYMQDGISVTVKSITTGGEQKLYLSAHDVNLLKGKKVAIVDDVISTGGSLKGLEMIVDEAGGTTIEKVTVLAEGDAAKRPDIKFLGIIPLL
ncbi:MAG: adenine phosphoribosyltransferase [Clostridia bacterium]|nr:adenine phosphoribosyltransferase [Clostridia bacterium]